MTTRTELGPKVDSWRAPRRVEAEDSVSRSTLTLAEARQGIKNRVREHLARGEPGLLIVTGVPGVGKTTITLRASEQVAAETGTHIAWFGTRHDQFETVDHDIQWRHVRGRSTDNCKHVDEARRLAQKGWSVTETLCKRCSLGPGLCDWWRQWQGDVHRYMPSQHLRAAPLWERSGLRLVFDELDATNFACQSVTLSLQALLQGAKTWPDLSGVLKQLVELAIEADTSWLADAPLYESLVSAVDDLPRPLPDATRPETGSLPNANIIEALKELSKELRRYQRGEAFVSRVVVCGRGLKYYPEQNLPEEIFAHPAVLLNSTADVDGIRHLLERPGYPVSVYSPTVRLHPNTEVEYVLDANHSKTTVELLGDPYREQWHDRVRTAIDKNHQTLVVTTKAGEEQLKKHFSELVGDKIELAHYGAVSGLNEYKDSGGVVLAQPFNPSPVAVAELYRRIYGGSRGDPLNLDTCYRLARLLPVESEKETFEVAVTSMEDERLAPLYEHWRQAEMIQAAHRVRPVLHERRIVVTCAIPLKDLPATAASYTSRRTTTRASLREAGARLLAQEGRFTRGDLADESDRSLSTVSRYWDDLIADMGLTIVEIAVPSERYPNGRTAKAAAKLPRSGGMQDESAELRRACSQSTKEVMCMTRN